MMLTRIIGRSAALKSPSQSQQAVRCFAAGDDKGILEKAQEKIGEATEKVSKAFQSDGKVGKQFEKDRTTGHEGTAAETAEKNVGGEFSGEGDIGKQFKSDGKVGGKIEELAEKGAQKGREIKKDA